MQQVISAEASRLSGHYEVGLVGRMKSSPIIFKKFQDAGIGGIGLVELCFSGIPFAEIYEQLDDENRMKEYMQLGEINLEDPDFVYTNVDDEREDFDCDDSVSMCGSTAASMVFKGDTANDIIDRYEMISQDVDKEYDRRKREQSDTSSTYSDSSMSGLSSVMSKGLSDFGNLTTENVQRHNVGTRKSMYANLGESDTSSTSATTVVNKSGYGSGKPADTSSEWTDSTMRTSTTASRRRPPSNVYARHLPQSYAMGLTDSCSYERKPSSSKKEPRVPMSIADSSVMAHPVSKYRQPSGTRTYSESSVPFQPTNQRMSEVVELGVPDLGLIRTVDGPKFTVIESDGDMLAAMFGSKGDGGDSDSSSSDSGTGSSSSDDDSSD